jgi:hypothetical protein
MILIERFTKRKRLLGFDTEGNLVARECTVCREFLSTAQHFSKHAGTNLGWNTKCKTCEESPKKKAYRKQYKAQNRESILAQSKEYRKQAKEKRQQYAIEYRKRKPEIVHRNSNNWKRKNAHVCIEYVRVRELKKKQGINTLTEDQKLEVKAIYKQCRELNQNGSGVVYCVDHIIPLTHPDVCGLHAPQNLRILTKLENNQKHNKFDGTPENESWRKRHEQ